MSCSVFRYRFINVHMHISRCRTVIGKLNAVLTNRVYHRAVAGGELNIQCLHDNNAADLPPGPFFIAQPFSVNERRVCYSELTGATGLERGLFVTYDRLAEQPLWLDAGAGLLPSLPGDGKLAPFRSNPANWLAYRWIWSLLADFSMFCENGMTCRFQQDSFEGRNFVFSIRDPDGWFADPARPRILDYQEGAPIVKVDSYLPMDYTDVAATLGAILFHSGVDCTNEGGKLLFAFVQRVREVLLDMVINFWHIPRDNLRREGQTFFASGNRVYYTAPHAASPNRKLTRQYRMGCMPRIGTRNGDDFVDAACRYAETRKPKPKNEDIADLLPASITIGTNDHAAVTGQLAPLEAKIKRANMIMLRHAFFYDSQLKKLHDLKFQQLFDYADVEL